MYVEVGFLFEIIFEHHLFKTEHVLLSNMNNEHQDDIFWIGIFVGIAKQPLFHSSRLLNVFSCQILSRSSLYF